MLLATSKKLYAIVFFCLGVVLVWNVGLYLSPAKTSLANYLFNIAYSLLYLVGGLVGIVGSRKIGLGSTIGKALMFLGLGNLAYTAGLLIWTYYNIIAKIEIPYPSFADALFVAFVPFVFMGIIFVLRIFKTHISWRFILESLVIFGVAIVLVFKFVYEPDLSTNLDLITRLANIAYPIGDSILLSLAYLNLRVAGGKTNTGILFLILGLFFQVAADITFAKRTTLGIYWNGDIADTFFVVAAVLLSLAIINLYSAFATNDAFNRQKAQTVAP